MTVIPGSISHGQGHDTMYKIILRDKLGIDADDIRVTALRHRHGARRRRHLCLAHGGPGRQRRDLAADKVIAKAKKIAAHVMEVADGDVDFGAASSASSAPTRRWRGKKSRRPPIVPRGCRKALETGLYETASFHPEIPNFPNGCHVCEVEIDPETGTSEVLRYCVVDDVGTVINSSPSTARSMAASAKASASASPSISFTIRNRASCSPARSWITACRARPICARSIPRKTRCRPRPTRLGVKGAGEAGNVGALAAIMNAVVDALAPLGITHIDMPATPERVWQAIRAARAA